MWVVIKYKSNEINLVRNKLTTYFGKDLKIYLPQISYKKFFNQKFKYIQRNILGDYLFCYNKNFSTAKHFTLLKNLKGVKNILNFSKLDQPEIQNFIDNCKKNSDCNGYLKHSFFESFERSSYQFINGPFTKYIFEIIKTNKKKFRLIVGNLKVTLKKESNYFYKFV